MDRPNNALKIRVIGEDPFNEILEAPFNPPVFTADYSEDDFDEEYCGYRTELRKLLESKSARLGIDEGFWLGDDYVFSRNFMVDVIDTRLLIQDVVVSLVYFLRKISIEYDISLTTDLSDSFCFLLVTRSAVIAANVECLRPFGLSEGELLLEGID